MRIQRDQQIIHDVCKSGARNSIRLVNLLDLQFLQWIQPGLEKHQHHACNHKEHCDAFTHVSIVERFVLWLILLLLFLFVRGSSHILLRLSCSPSTPEQRTEIKDQRTKEQKNREQSPSTSALLIRGPSGDRAQSASAPGRGSPPGPVPWREGPSSAGWQGSPRWAGQGRGSQGGARDKLQ